jgi:hypothetical protein
MHAEMLAETSRALQTKREKLEARIDELENSLRKPELTKKR